MNTAVTRRATFVIEAPFCLRYKDNCFIEQDYRYELEKFAGFIWTHRESGNMIQLIVSTRVEGSLCDIDLTVFFRSSSSLYWPRPPHSRITRWRASSTHRNRSR